MIAQESSKVYRKEKIKKRAVETEEEKTGRLGRETNRTQPRRKLRTCAIFGRRRVKKKEDEVKLLVHIIAHTAGSHHSSVHEIPPPC